jgi:hypothetical protein
LKTKAHAAGLDFTALENNGATEAMATRFILQFSRTCTIVVREGHVERVEVRETPP